VAFVDENYEVKLNPYEHSEYKWIRIDEAETYLTFENQIVNIKEIDKFFVQKKTNPFLEINYK